LVAIIDYGMGNVASVQKALNYLKLENEVTKDAVRIEKAKYIILPGVGSFQQGISNLRKDGLDAILNVQVLDKKKPFLGICLGMQLIASIGTEPDECEGLNWIQGMVTRLQDTGKRVPHLGWNNIEVHDSPFFKNIPDLNFYFIHSYHFQVKDESCISATVNYGMEIVAAIHKENILATQFHPEKSQQAGIQLMKNFFEYFA